ncbi:MAG: hypothetical protein CVU38_04605 [Chloroflexi bacterium HGW-Chloroflexi-1]|nr:MAG: hypothetical protein CVU38_04605 [Chloroflexi bacterium HGW-Chloroflexi-1]
MRVSRLIFLVIVCLLATLSARPACAGDGVWTTLNTTPFGPTELTIHPGSPGNVYAVSPRLTLISRDGGGEWTLADDLPPGTRQLVFDPLTPSIVYALIGGQLQQRIGVESWTILAPGLLKGIMGFTINADNPNQLWIVTGSDLLRSEDGGSSWTRNPLAVSGNVTALALGWPDSLHVYVALAGLGFFHSTDGGASWNQAGAGLEGAGNIYALQVDGLVAGTLYLAADGGLYRSIDHGANWVPLGSPQPSYRSNILLWTGAGGGTLYTAAGDVIYHSEDKGATWKTAQQAPQSSIIRLVAEPGNPAVMYAISGGAVLKSFDAGANWTPPPAQGGYIVVAAHPTTSGLLLANHVRGGAWRSTDSGRTWTQIEQGWPVGQSIGAFHMHAGDPDRMFAAAGNALLISRDAGQSWASTGMPTADRPWAIATAPTDPAVILVSLGRVILRSSDGGTFWKAAQLPGNVQANDLWLAPEDATQVMAATTQGLYRSTDGGASWGTVGGIGQVNCRNLWSGAQPGEVYVSTDNGLVSSSDSGATWSSSPAGVGLAGGAGRILRDWSDPNVLYAVLGDRIFISPNGGLHWMPVGGALAFTPAYLAADGMTPRQLYADDEQGRNQWRLTLPEIPPTPTLTPTPTSTLTPTVTFTPLPETPGLTLTPLARLTPTPADETTDGGRPSTLVLALGGMAVVAVLGAGGFLFARSHTKSTARKEG